MSDEPVKGSVVLDIICERLVREGLANGTIVPIVHECPCCGYPKCGHKHSEPAMKGTLRDGK